MNQEDFIPLFPVPMFTVLIKGLALSHCKMVSTNDWDWEVLFHRDDANLHNLTASFNGAVPIPVEKGAEITIIVADRTKIKNTEPSYKKANFTRDPINDDAKDWQWILNFSGNDLHRGAMKTKRDPAKSNLLTIPKATFYTGYRDKRPYQLKRKLTGVIKPLGVIGDAIAAYILVDDSTDVFLDLGSGVHKLNPGSVVIIDNECKQPAAVCQSDFAHYYRIVDAQGDEFELLLAGLTPFFGEDYSCGGSTVDQLLNPTNSLNER